MEALRAPPFPSFHLSYDKSMLHLPFFFHYQILLFHQLVETFKIKTLRSQNNRVIVSNINYFYSPNFIFL